MTHPTATTSPTPAPAPSAAQVFRHVEVMEQLLRTARLADALSAVDSKLCWAIKNSRDCDLPELEAGLLHVQAQFDVLVARLQPALLCQAQQPV